jgi:ribA/ribD-fused uncharacterized protein
MSEKLTHDQVNQPGPKDKIFFYPKDFYVFDNFSSFQVEYQGFLFQTAEHAYQSMKFIKTNTKLFEKVKNSKSAHDAYKIASKNKNYRDPEWENKKIQVMKNILENKIDQHPYVLKKLIESGEREIIEDSWRDPIWGWGEDKKGQNLLGKLWMELREQYSSHTQ